MWSERATWPTAYAPRWTTRSRPSVTQRSIRSRRIRRVRLAARHAPVPATRQPHSDVESTTHIGVRSTRPTISPRARARMSS